MYDEDKQPHRRRFVAVTIGVVAAAVALGGGVALVASNGAETPVAAPSGDAPASTTTPPTTPRPTTPATTPATTTPPATPAETIEAASHPTPPASTPPAYSLDTIGPRSYGPLRFGMSRAAALDTGLLGSVEARDRLCTRYAGTFGGNVVVSNRWGVVNIRVTRPVEYKGLHVGSTVADVKAAYPKGKPVEDRNGLHVATAPGIVGFDIGGYHLHHTPWPDTGVIYRIEIGATNSDCAFAF